MKIKTKFKNFVKRFIRIMSLNEMQVLPGHLAFFFVISIIPLFVFIGIIGNNYFNTELIEAMNSVLPRAISGIFVPLIQRGNPNVNVWLFFAVSFILTTNACNSIILVSNSIYKVSNSNLIRMRIKAFVMTIILVLLLFFVTIVPGLGDSILNVFSEYLKINISGTVYFIYQIIKYFISTILIFFSIKLLYTLAPDKKISSRCTNYGAMFTTIGWLFMTEIYSYYIENFTNYDMIYGSISNILILLLWIYLVAYIFVFGMALNTDKYLDN